MKKIISVILSVLLICSLCALPVFAQDEVAQASSADNVGETASSADNIGETASSSVSQAPTGVIFDEENTSHTVTASPADNTDEAPTDAIPEAPGGALIGGATDYSLEELNEIADQIKAMTADETWITGIKIDETHRMIIIGIEENADPSKEKTLAKTLSEKYGNAVAGALIFTGNIDAELETDIIAEGGGVNESSGAWFYAALAAIVLLAVFAAVFFSQRARQRAYTTSAGEVACESEGLSRRAVIEDVQKSGYTPTDKTFSEICDKIERTK